MAKYEAKYLKDGGPVDAFIGSVENPTRRADAETTLALYREVTGLEPRMWGSSIVGFGESVFRYPSGNKSPVPAACFSPRKQCMVLYLGRDFEDAEALYARLGKHSTSSTGGCININKLVDVDLGVLREIVDRSFRASLQRADA